MAKKRILTVTLLVFIALPLLAAIFVRRGTVVVRNDTDRTVFVFARSEWAPGQVQAAWHELQAGDEYRERIWYVGVARNIGVLATSDASREGLAAVAQSYAMPVVDQGRLESVLSPTTKPTDEPIRTWDTALGDKVDVHHIHGDPNHSDQQLGLVNVPFSDGAATFYLNSGNNSEIFVSKVAITNVTPFNVRLAHAFPTSVETWLTAGWTRIEPGQTWSTVRVHRNVMPQHWVLAETELGDHELVRQASTRTGSPRSYITWTEPTDSPMAITMIAPPTNFQTEVSANRLAAAPRHLINIPYVSDGKFVTSLQLPNETHTNPDALGKRVHDMPLLRAALQDAIALGESEFAFSPGVELSDLADGGHVVCENGVHAALALGVRVTATMANLPAGQPMPFQVGDIIEWYAGRPIFSVHDLYTALQRHGFDRSKGVEEPVPFVVRRTTDEFWGATTYWFLKQPCERAFFEGKVIDSTDALWNGLADGALFGTQEEVRAGISRAIDFVSDFVGWVVDENYVPPQRTNYSERRWILAQREGCLRQWFPDARLAGDLGSLVINIPRSALKLAAGAAGRKALSATTVRVAFEIGEQLVYTQIADPVLLRSAAQLELELTLIVGFGAAGGAISRVPSVSGKAVDVP